MSSDYYFRKWKCVLAQLENLVNLDLDFQTAKAHDKKRCDAAQRLSGVLGAYSAIYNDAMDCLQQNLQMQKTEYIEQVIKAIVDRILELKHQLRQLESSNYQFLSHGLITHKLTTYDAELSQLPPKQKRVKQVQNMINDVIKRAKEKKDELEEKVEEENEKALEDLISQKIKNWWDDDTEGNENMFSDKSSDFLNKKISDGVIIRKQMVALIQAHEKTRQITIWFKQRGQRLERWRMELEGTSKSQAPFEIRERSARIIQNVMRAYFSLKRYKEQNCKRDELLGIKLCKKQNPETFETSDKIKTFRCELSETYKNEWISKCSELRRQYLKRRDKEIAEEFRDQIREWFRVWFQEVKFFHDIPKENQGGSALILKEELPTPSEWLEQYETYIEEKNTNKNKTAVQLKWEKMEAKKVELTAKRQERLRKKMDEVLTKKIMKNPNMHPGFQYPKSKKNENIYKAINKYHNTWDELDFWKTTEVKERSVKNIDVDNASMEVKIKIRKIVDEDMREELKLLNKALKDDYKRNGGKMPERMPLKRSRRKKKKFIIKSTINEHIAEKIEDLALKGFIKEYPKTNLEDFIGEYNFAGDDLRCMYEPAAVFGGETRNVWWERCCEIANGFQKILLVGPEGSGKTVLVHALASVNDAILFEVNHTQLEAGQLSAVYLQQLVDAIASSAKAVQPSVIYIKHIEQLYFKKVSEETSIANIDQIRNNLIRALKKKIRKTDKITIVGSCSDPWLTNSKKILKQFPVVLLMPNTNYTTVVKLLQEWMTNNHTIPNDLNIHSLAYVLQGYRFSFLKEILEKFLTPERIIMIAAYGLTPGQVYEYIIQNGGEAKSDYTKYMKWYSENTYWGKKEKKKLQEQREFKLWAEKFAKKNTSQFKKQQSAITSTSS